MTCIIIFVQHARYDNIVYILLCLLKLLQPKQLSNAFSSDGCNLLRCVRAKYVRLTAGDQCARCHETQVKCNVITSSEQ